MDKFRFAYRTNWRQETNALNKALEELESRHIPVMDLTASNPTVCGFVFSDEMLSALNVPENLRYQPDACGMRKARQAVADHYARQKVFLSPGDIILTASTSEAYSFLMRLLVNPGEKILIPRPSYPLFQFLLEINDVNFDYYPLHYDGHWRIDYQALERCVDSKTKAIILVNPNNPTGSFVSTSELNALNEICRNHQMAIISDEVFFEYSLSPADAVSCAGNQAVLTFALGGLSKTLALPQMKCAWILASGPQLVLQESLDRLEIISDTYLSINTPVQNALSLWLDHAPEIQEQIIFRVKENWQWLKAHLSEHTELLSLQGGWYVTLRIPAVKSEEEWVLEFLKEDHVLVYPGYFFDFEREAYIVLSLLPPAPIFQEAAGRILSRLARI
ncbi:MAG: pyridoxal phosphate-dependent aminotransferase [Candidatus Omnitrophica bacterium]|nr:pyridoxal phosphate-dependent aminotransferase [Candidatus Omnitrophota bacterium]